MYHKIFVRNKVKSKTNILKPFKSILNMLENKEITQTKQFYFTWVIEFNIITLNQTKIIYASFTGENALSIL